jgi:hypothetical protein
MQNEAPSLQTPPWHRLEQHWLPVVHGLPAVRQAVLSGWQRPPSQLPLQQLEESVQALSSATQALALQKPEVHASEQHSVDDWQGPPVKVHLLMEATQVAEVGSHRPEQQSVPEAHCWPNCRQKGDVPPVVPPCPVLPPPALASPGG